LTHHAGEPSNRSPQRAVSPLRDEPGDDHELADDRRDLNVTDAPTAQWTVQQLVEAFPWQSAPRYLLRDRDAVYGVVFLRRAQSMGIHEVKTAARSPWQNPYVERLIGTLRRECLDHVVV
jgi:hypothetical protein